MPVPFQCRRISSIPKAYQFTPRVAPLFKAARITLQLNKHETLKFADLHKMGQKTEAELMTVSRNTSGNIPASIRRKLADAVVNGKALRIEGGQEERGK